MIKNLNLSRTVVTGTITKDGFKEVEGQNFCAGSISVRTRGGENPNYDYFEITAPMGLAPFLNAGRVITVTGQVESRAYLKGDGTAGSSLRLRNSRIELDGVEEVIVKGNVGPADQIRLVEGGDKGNFVSFPLAVSQGSGDNQRTSWYKVNANVGEGKTLPDSMVEAIKQGTPLAIVGVARADAYLADGEARASTVLYARMVQFGQRVDGDADAGSDDEPNFD